MSLPIYQTQDKNFSLMQTQWSSQLNPVIENPSVNSVILKAVPLKSAASPNVINHLLGRKLQGWKIVRQRAAASIHDTQDNNTTMADLTLWLITTADVVVDIEVF